MRVLVVDDEQEIRNYIANMPEWDSIQSRVIATAANGAEALEIIRKVQLDILLTDIRMPEMDGIALAEMIRKTDPDLPIIFLSAYNDFEYAKKAIRLGAVDFITKPFISEDLIRVVELVKEQQKLEWKHQEAFFSLFSVPDQRNEEKQEWLLQHNQQNDSFVLLYAELDHILGTEEGRSSFRERKIVASVIPELEKCVYPCWTLATSGGLYILIRCVSSDGSALREEAIELARRIVDSSEDLEDQRTSLSVGISQLQRSLFDLPEAIRQTAQNMEYRMLLGKKSVIAYDAIQSIMHEKEQDVILSINRLAELLRTGNDEGIHNLLREAYRRMLTIGASKKEIQHFCISLSEQAESVMEEFGTALDSNTVVAIREKILSSLILTDMMRDLEQHIRMCATQINQMLDQSPKRLVVETKHIIEQEYMKELTLQEVARRLNVNYSYLSRLIKKETNRNFSDLLWQTRIEAAKVMLLSEDMKAYEVAYAVGFKDATHFSLLFKKMVGVSPSVYKVQTAGQRNVRGSE